LFFCWPQKERPMHVKWRLMEQQSDFFEDALH
jgi:hypothetical protein